MNTFGLVAIAEIAGLLEPRAAGPAPPFLHEGARNFRGGESAQGPEEPAAVFQADGTELKLRTDSDYRGLALQILSLPSDSAKKKHRAIGRLMNRALSGG
ncbi:hypothetical protein ASD00_26870 [Ensifer sp. Root31]|uniref:hypothetical protein n=1 Tax=Ensifer sp. Root31 TaxID=1736512 RepID=UPI00070FB5C7|nr:hypothetical protein [Ensifer sp. Root31]KQU89480.1 hypothetical protein ASD00_26870 [Ensifer sp. Root31]